MEALTVRPTGELIQKFVEVYEKEGNYAKENISAAYELVEKIPENKTYKEIFTKMVFINGAFKTRIGDIDGVVRQFFEKEMQSNKIDVDKMLSEGDIALVDKIAGCYRTKEDKERYNYSFATKYCHCHNKEAFPIYDRYALESLMYFNKKYKFSKFTKTRIKEDYKEFFRAFLDFKSFANAESLTNQMVDRFLWVLGGHLIALKPPKQGEEK